MNTINDKAIYISSILGRQEYDIQKKYRPLYSLIKTKCSDGYIIYNTLTKQMILMSQEEYENFNNYGTLENSCMKKLVEDYFLVPYDFDEMKCCTQIRNVYNLIDTDNSITSYVILPTTDCNARCFYCCQHGQKRVTMTEKTAKDTAKYIAERCNGKKVYIMWFGGEPLCNINAINIISSELRDLGIEFKSNMISNSYLFDEEIVCIAKSDWNLKSVQVTLDGTEDIYNKTKAYIYKDNINPFVKIIENIKILADYKIKVVIRLNMDLYNKDNLYTLVDFLYEKFKNNDYVAIYARMLFDNTSKLQLERTNDERSKLYKEFSEFEDYIDSKGMYHCQSLHSIYTPNRCVGTNKHGNVIMPGGELGMCDLHTDNYIYGNIYDGIKDESVIKDFMQFREPVTLCSSCPILPNCSRLKKCDYYIRECEDYEQKRLIREMERFVLHTYKKKMGLL